MTEEVQQSSEGQLLKPKENIKDSWWPVVQFILLLVGSTFLFFIPLVIVFPELFQNAKHEIGNSLLDQFWFGVTNQLIPLVSAFFTTWVIIVNIERSTLKTFGLTIRSKDLLIGFSIGAITIVAFAVLGYCLGFVEFSFNEIRETIFGSFILLMFVAISEEVIIRGYLLYKLRFKVGDLGALLLTSSVFGIMHFFNEHFTWVGCVNICLSGFLMGLVVLRTTSISSAIGMHWAWNFIQGPILGFAVSGRELPSIFNPKTGSYHQLMGGNFGAEGSVLLIPITLIFILLVYKYLNPKNAGVPPEKSLP